MGTKRKAKTIKPEAIEHVEKVAQTGTHDNTADAIRAALDSACERVSTVRMVKDTDASVTQYCAEMRGRVLDGAFLRCAANISEFSIPEAIALMTRVDEAGAMKRAPLKSWEKFSELIRSLSSGADLGFRNRSGKASLLSSAMRWLVANAQDGHTVKDEWSRAVSEDIYVGTSTSDSQTSQIRSFGAMLGFLELGRSGKFGTQALIDSPITQRVREVYADK